MGLWQLARPTVNVRWNDRVFVCGPPTGRTVVLAIALFPAEIVAIARVAYAKDADMGSDPIGICLPAFLQAPEHLGTVLESCVAGGAPGEISAAIASPEGRKKGIAERLVRAVADTCDLRRVCRELQLDSALESDEMRPTQVFRDPGGHVDAQTMGMVVLGQAFGCAPHEVLEWPFEEILDATIAMTPQDKLRPEGRAPASIPGFEVARPEEPSDG